MLPIKLVISENNKVIESISKETSTQPSQLVKSLEHFQREANAAITKMIENHGDVACREKNFLAFNGFTVRVPGPSHCRGGNVECAVPGTCNPACNVRKKKTGAPYYMPTNAHLHCPSSPLCLAKFGDFMEIEDGEETEEDEEDTPVSFKKRKK